MKVIKTTEAEGMTLCHDITQIIKGVVKDTVFRKGHVITKEDIPVLLSVGKDNIYIWEDDENLLHENDGAEILCKMCKGANLTRSEVKEGKINLFADCDGILKINREAMKAVNSFGQLMISSKFGDIPVKKGDVIAATRIIPLVIEKEKMERIEQQVNEITGGKPIFEIKEFKPKKVAIIATGNEVFYGRIKDTFTPVIIDKISQFGAEVFDQMVLGDDDKKLTENIQKYVEAGADMVLCTGGMSVDPDDKTPLAIKNTGARIVCHGSPILPGAMFLLAYCDRGDGKPLVPVMGLPGGVMFAKNSVFDLVLPRAMADDEITSEDIVNLGEGGMLGEGDGYAGSRM